MRGLVCKKAGDFDQIKIEKMTVPEPKANQVQIKVKAVSLSTSDFKAFSEKIENGKVSIGTKIISSNKPFGGDVAGVITKIGKNVTFWKLGDEVYASIGINGGCKEWIVTDADKIFMKPENLTYEEAATIPTAGIVAMEACKKAKIHKGSKVLIYGASGGVGQFCMMIAKVMGGSITAVCSTQNVDVAYDLGAERVIDYKKQNILDHNEQFDAILGVNGDISLATYKKLLKDEGTYVAIGGKQAMSGLLGPIYALGSKKHMTFVIYAFAIRQGHLKTLTKLAEKKQITPFIEKICKPNEVKEILENVCKNHARGKIVVRIDFDGKI